MGQSNRKILKRGQSPPSIWDPDSLKSQIASHLKGPSIKPIHRSKHCSYEDLRATNSRSESSTHSPDSVGSPQNGAQQSGQTRDPSDKLFGYSLESNLPGFPDDNLSPTPPFSVTKLKNPFSGHQTKYQVVLKEDDQGEANSSTGPSRKAIFTRKRLNGWVNPA